MGSKGRMIAALAWLGLALLIGVAIGGQGSPAVGEPKPPGVIQRLGDPDANVREEATRALAADPTAAPWLRQAARASNREVARRAGELLAECAKQRQAAAPKALAATTKFAQADVFLEWFFFWQPGNPDNLWEAGFDFGAVGLKAYADLIPGGYKHKGRLGDWAIKSLDHLRLGDWASKGLEHLRLPPRAIEFKTWDGPYRPDAFNVMSHWLVRTDVLPDPARHLVLGAVRGEAKSADLIRSYLYTLGNLPPPRRMSASVVVCDGAFGARRADVRLGLAGAGYSIIVSRQDVLGVDGDVRGVVILAGGDVHLENGTFDNCTILARGTVHRPKWGKFNNCRIESDVKDATAPFKFFELADVGLGVAKPADKDAKGLAVESVREKTLFGAAGLTKGDTILAIDGEPVTTPEEFRKQVRKAMVVHGDCLLTVSRGGKTLELPAYFPLPP